MKKLLFLSILILAISFMTEASDVKRDTIKVVNKCPEGCYVLPNEILVLVKKITVKK